MKTRSAAALACLCTLWWTPLAASFLERPDVRSFIDEIAARGDFNAAELRGLFEDVEHQGGALEAIREPAEALPWFRYRPIFVTDARIGAGVRFMRRHVRLLERARREYGVPPAVVTAILGVETFYGRHVGHFPVLDTLATLAFDYPPRSAFFRRELEQFLLLARSEGVVPRGVKGSYAGAMGMPQFIASSYRRYAVDFDGDGRRDLWHSTADVVGSVAAYLARRGWRRDKPIAHRVLPVDGRWRALADDGLEPAITAAELDTAGIAVDPPLADGEEVTVIALEGETEDQAWVGRRNFYVITRYNQSALYAMAVFQLAERIRAAAAEGGA